MITAILVAVQSVLIFALAFQINWAARQIGRLRLRVMMLENDVTDLGCPRWKNMRLQDEESDGSS